MRTHLFPIPGPWPGHLAIISRPRGGDWLEDEALGWQRDGIGVVISLLEPEESAPLDLLHESDAAAAYGVHCISSPIPDRGVPERIFSSRDREGPVSSQCIAARALDAPVPSQPELSSFRGRAPPSA